jgi:ascorbate PTS system EIIC component
MSVLDFVIQLLKTPAILIGLVAMLGLIFMKKSFTQILLGTVKTILGFLILNLGVSTVSGGLGFFNTLFTTAFGLKGILFDDNIAVGAMMKTIGQEVSLVMVFGFLANLLFARFTKAKIVYLTGHKVWHMAGGLAFVLLTLGLTGVPLVAIGALILGAYMVIGPWLLQPFTKKVTGSDEYAVGHTMGSMYLFGAFVGKLLGNKDGKKIDDTKLPSGLEAFRDMSIAVSVIMLLMFAVPSIFAPAKAQELAGAGNSVALWILIQALTAAGGFLIIMQGVRMFIGELIPAFKGFAKIIVPSAIPALDCPVVFPFSPTSVVVGLITGFIGWLVGMFICIAIPLSVVPIPSMIAILFGCTTAAVYGNSMGGARGAVAAGFLSGLIWPIVGALFYPVLPLVQYGVSGSALMSPDIYIIVSIIKGIGMLFGLVH